jgi:hypothetical protein
MKKTRAFYQSLFGFKRGHEWNDFWSEFATEPLTLCLKGSSRANGSRGVPPTPGKDPDRAGRDAGLLDGMDRRSLGQPPLSPFEQGRLGGLSDAGLSGLPGRLSLRTQKTARGTSRAELTHR